ncbi:hypothetical protein [Leptospira noguchii]|uniref:hypothetical protein n=1 Tax=Leptospira noguchii TaxID=28182 RepID=UPI001FB61DF4|nr:hypothetical protein [Leptospira noguchii]UOG55073.1 hypothetical protein MAL09_21895 [Leptospira noguchii]
MIASIQSSLPQEVSNNGVSQYIQAQEKELAEKQEKANELLSHMNSLVTNNNDLAALQALLQGSSQGLNLAANSAVSKYLDDYAKKLQKDNEERSSNLQKTLLESLTNGDDYKYLRDAGYGFRVDGEGITAYREVYSGEIEINGSAMKSTSYSPDLEYQYIRIETKFNPGNLSVDMLNPNNTTFSAEMVSGVKRYIDNLQKNVEVMFAQFSDKTKEVKEEYVQNEEIESYQKKLYEASKDNYLAAFQGLPGEFKEMFEGEMGGLKGYHEQGSKYNFGQGSFKGQSGDMKKIGKSMYDGAIIDDTVFAGSRELKGSVSVKGIPVEVSYGMQYLIVTSGFDISNLGYNFNLKGLGTNYVDNQLSGVSQKYSIYTKDIQSRIEKQAKANDAEMDKKGFVFNVLNGMSGGQKVTQAVEGEIRSRVTGAIAEATGLPASFVGALVGGSNMKQAMKAYEKSVTTEAISKATGIPSWYLDQKIAEKEANHAMAQSFSYNLGRAVAVGAVLTTGGVLAGVALATNPKLMDSFNKFADHIGKQAYENKEIIDTAVTVAATVAAPMTGGMSLVALAGYNVVKGATEGGVLGALAGVANVGSAYLSTYTFGIVSYNLSYSYADGFGASVGGGWQVAKGLGVGATLSYNEQSGFGASVGFQAGTSALSFNGGLSYSQRDGVSANAGVGIGLGGKKPTGSLNLGVSYNKQDGLGTSAGISSNNNKITHGMGLNITRSEYGGWGADVSSDNYGPGNLSGGLAYTQRDGFTVSLNVNGTNAFNYNSQSGLSSNTDFMSQYAMNNGLAQGVAEDTDTSDPNSAQQHNNAEQGAQVIEGAGIEVAGRKPESDGETSFEHLSENDQKNLNKEIEHLQSQYDKLQGVELAGLGTSSLPEKAALDKLTRVGNEVSAYLDFKEGKISKAEFDKRVGDAKSTYANNTQGERDKIPLNTKKDPGKYTDVSRENLKGLTHLEDSKGVIGRIVKDGDGNMYFRTEAQGLGSKSIPMEPTKITEKPYTKIDPHDQSKYPGSVDLHAPYGSPMTVMKSDDGKFKVTGLRSLSEGGNSLSLEYKLGGVVRQVDLRHAQNQFPSYVIDQLKSNPAKALTFDNGTVVGWTGVTGQHGIGNDGKIKWDTTDHTHAEFKNSNATQWKDWGLKGMGF